MAGPHPRDPLSLPDDGVDYVGGTAPRLRLRAWPTARGWVISRSIRSVAAVVADAVEALTRSGVEIDESSSTSVPDHDELADLWVRTISVHYAAIAVHWKRRGIDLLGDHADELTPQFRAMLEDRAASGVGRSIMRSTTCCAAVFSMACRTSSTASTSSLRRRSPSRRSATRPDGNTIGPVEINGEAVDPLIGWCMTYPINFTGHPAISVPAGLHAGGIAGGSPDHRPPPRRRNGAGLRQPFERVRPWFQTYPGLARSRRPPEEPAEASKLDRELH